MQNINVPMNLPFNFDTLGLGRKIFQIIFGAELFIIIFGGGYCLFVSVNIIGFLLLLFICIFISFFTVIFIRNFKGACGTVTVDNVLLKSNHIFGFFNSESTRRIPINDFDRIIVEIIPPSNEHTNEAERVLLISKSGKIDILLAREKNGNGRKLGKALNNLLRIPYEERLVSY
jgi:hypothetical protein